MRRRKPHQRLLRNAGTVGGNLCQGTRCWVLPHPWARMDLLARRRRHLLRTDRRPPKARARARRSHLLRIRPTLRRHSPRQGRPWSCAAVPASASSCCSISTAVRPRRIGRWWCSSLASSSPRAADPRRPSGRLTCEPASAAPSRSRSSPLPPHGGGRICAWSRRGWRTSRESLDPGDPLDGLPGHPQSAWKRDVLAELVRRAAAGRRLGLSCRPQHSSPTARGRSAEPAGVGALVALRDASASDVAVHR